MYRLLIGMLPTIRRYCIADIPCTVHACWTTTRSERKNRRHKTLFQRDRFDASLVRSPPTQVVTDNAEPLVHRSAMGTRT